LEFLNFGEFFKAKKEKIILAKKLLESLKISPNKLAEFGINIKQDGVLRSAFELLSFPEINFAEIEKIWAAEIAQIDQETKKQISIDATYSSYLKRQEQDLAIFRQDENMKIPLNIDYEKIQSLSNEVREKLKKFRPATISAAFKIQGITPASIMAVMVYVKNNF
jgi:tRNA uridine 5-carboxymethylaminomethyl modification enzyme